MRTQDSIRRANRRILVAMVIFAIALCVLCFVWMYGRMKRYENGVLSGDRRPAAVLPVKTLAGRAPSDFCFTCV